jgi:carbon storage regulator
VIGENVEVMVLAISRNQVRLGIEAPKEITVNREEVHRRTKGAGGEGDEAVSAQVRPGTDSASYQVDQTAGRTLARTLG